MAFTTAHSTINTTCLDPSIFNLDANVNANFPPPGLIKLPEGYRFRAPPNFFSQGLLRQAEAHTHSRAYLFTVPSDVYEAWHISRPKLFGRYLPVPSSGFQKDVGHTLSVDQPSESADSSEEESVLPSGLDMSFLDSSCETLPTIDSETSYTSDNLTADLDEEAKTDAWLREYDETRSPSDGWHSNPFSPSTNTSPITGSMPLFSYLAPDCPISPSDSVVGDAAPYSIISMQVAVTEEEVGDAIFDSLS